MLNDYLGYYLGTNVATNIESVRYRVWSGR